jgi:hypothetical protein
MSLLDVDLEALLGADAAEDEDEDRLLKFFLKTPTWDAVTDQRRALRILVGNKGTGKSAIFRVSANEDEEAGRLPVFVRPDDLIGIAEGETDHLRLVRAWKDGLTGIIIENTLRSLGSGEEGFFAAAKASGGRVLDVLVKMLGKKQANFELDPARQALADSFLKRQQLVIYIDDLDRGWSGRLAEVKRLAAMFDAVRDFLRENNKLRCRIGLRTDVYTLIRMTEASSDKYETAVVHHAWENHEVFVLLIKRIESYFGRDADYDALLQRRQPQLAHFLDPIVARRFRGRGLWSNVPMYHVIMSFARRRPRDLIKLLTFAGREAQNHRHEQIQTADLETIFETFSQGRLQDTINEFGSELPKLRDVLLAMKPTRQEKTTAEGYVLTTDAMVKRLQNVLQSVDASFADNRPMTPMSLLAFLYKIDFLQARKNVDGEVVRRYFDQNHLLTPDKIDVGFDWEVQLAFRWVLQPDRPQDIYRFTDPLIPELP